MTKIDMRVAVLGAGSWGTTVARLTSVNAPTVLWARSPELARSINETHRNERYLPDFELPRALRATADIAEATRDADVIVMGVPVKGFRTTLTEVAQHARPWVPIVSLSKGLESGTRLRMSEVVAQTLPGHPVAVLTGPNLAREIMDGQAAASVIGMSDLVVARALQPVFTSGLFRVYTNHDVIGCEIAGALKNVIAIAAGMAQSLSVGDNTRAMVVTRGLAEIARLGVAMGGESATFSGLAGLGDLLATCMSPHSRNRHVGEQLGRGRTIAEITTEMKMVAEGVSTAKVVMELAASHGIEMPICAEISGVMDGSRTPMEAYRGLVRRRAGHESESG